jgi:DNA-binding CsgD family transcriptional regulator/tetratricopeptide (TPR) repeat protein
MPGSELLERSEQQASIAAALRDARHGDGRVLVIEGAAGIGKSRLLQELRAAAVPAQRVLSARASELERGFAFGVVRQLFEGSVRDPQLGPRILDGAAASAQAIFDEIPGEGGVASFALLHGLHWLALNLAEDQPLVLAIDDLHWCDASSLRFLAYLSRRLEGTSILVAAATRPVTPSTVDAELVAELLGEPRSVHVHPRALSAEAAAELIADQLGQAVDPSFAAACFAATDGNPLLLRQLARSLEAEGTAPTAANAPDVRRAAHRALSRTVIARVGRQSPAAIELARAVAVLGDTATAPLVGALTEIDTAEVGPAWRQLVEAEVLRRETLSFVHALVRDAVYFDLPEPSRQTLHARAARILAESGATAERVASQLALAPCGADPWAAGMLHQAGQAAMRRGAPDAAAAYLQRALDEPAPPDQVGALKAQLAEALFDVDASATVELLRELAAQEPTLRGRAEIMIGLTQALALTDHWTEAASMAETMAAELGADDDLGAMFQAVRLVAGLFGADGEDGPPLVPQYRVLEENAPLGRRVRAGQAALLWMYDGGSAADCADLARRAVADDPSVLRDHTLIAAAPAYVLGLADQDDGLQLWERARDEAHRTGSLVLNLNINLWLGAVQQRRGDLTSSITLLTDALDLMMRWGSGQEAMRYASAILALALVETGDVAGARRVLRQDAAEPLQDATLGSVLWWHANSWVLFTEGRMDEALAATYTLEHRTRWIKAPIGHDFRIPRALILHRQGDLDAAVATADESVAIAERWGAPGMLGGALRARGEVRGDDGVDDLRRSVSVLDGSPARTQLTRSLITYGAALRRARQPTEARQPLERAYELAVACGSPGLAELARVELAATGVKRRPGDVAGAESLTPSERRVADLAAGGQSNREIAQQLFVTPKTVEVHLSAAYRKLGIGSRHALAQALA